MSPFSENPSVAPSWSAGEELGCNTLYHQAHLPPAPTPQLPGDLRTVPILAPGLCSCHSLFLEDYFPLLTWLTTVHHPEVPELTSHLCGVSPDPQLGWAELHAFLGAHAFPLEQVLHLVMVNVGGYFVMSVSFTTL